MTEGIKFMSQTVGIEEHMVNNSQSFSLLSEKEETHHTVRRWFYQAIAIRRKLIDEGHLK